MHFDPTAENTFQTTEKCQIDDPNPCKISSENKWSIINSISHFLVTHANSESPPKHYTFSNVPLFFPKFLETHSISESAIHSTAFVIECVSKQDQNQLSTPHLYWFLFPPHKIPSQFYQSWQNWIVGFTQRHHYLIFARPDLCSCKESSFISHSLAFSMSTHLNPSRLATAKDMMLGQQIVCQWAFLM